MNIAFLGLQWLSFHWLGEMPVVYYFFKRNSNYQLSTLFKVSVRSLETDLSHTRVCRRGLIERSSTLERIRPRTKKVRSGLNVTDIASFRDEGLKHVLRFQKEGLPLKCTWTIFLPITALLLAQKEGHLSKTDCIIIGFWETAHLPLP